MFGLFSNTNGLYRIVRKKGKFVDYWQLQKNFGWFGWHTIFGGTEQACFNVLDAIKKYNRQQADEQVVHEEQL